MCGQPHKLKMTVDQRFLYHVKELFQAIRKTQENFGEVVKIKNQQNEVNLKLLQDSIHMKSEVKYVLVAIEKSKCQDSLQEHLPSRMIRKCSQIGINVNKVQTTAIIEKKSKLIVKCWGCGGDHFYKKCSDKGYNKTKMHEAS